MKPSSFSNALVAVVGAYAEALAEAEGTNAQLQVALRNAVQAPKPDAAPTSDSRTRSIAIESAARRLTIELRGVSNASSLAGDVVFESVRDALGILERALGEQTALGEQLVSSTARPRRTEGS